MSLAQRLQEYQNMLNDNEEIMVFEKLLHNNANLLFKYAENGGIKQINGS